MRRLLFILISIFLISCGQKKDIPGSYYLKEESGWWNLYYDLGNGGLGRIDDINKLGWTDKYIYTQSGNEYYWLDKTIDGLKYNYNEIVKGPITEESMRKLMSSMGIKDLNFQMVDL